MNVRPLFFSASLLLGSLYAQAQSTTKAVLPKAQSAEELSLRLPAVTSPYFSFDQKQLPADLVVPAEWEESKAILLAWPYPSSGTSSYSKLWAKLISTIQTECEVWILVDQPSDTLQVHSYLGAQNVVLNNHRFMIKPTNAFWARDYGPWGFYHTDQDSLAFMDIRYYSGRPLDDAVPAWLAGQQGIPNFQSRIKMEGGNFMVDGFGHGFFSSRLPDNNANPAIQNPTWNSVQTMDTVMQIFNLNQATQLQKLVCDGGTGHIDMYVKLLDEENLIVSEYPQTVTAVDRQTIENNVLLLQTLTTTYGRPFKVHRIEMPTGNSGQHSTSCTQIDNDARGFVNGFFANKTFLFPSYSSTTSGNVAADSAATRLYRKLLPGYRVVPIDARALTTSGGAIHCVTMQIPADNPVRFWHPSIAQHQSLADSSFSLLARITNKSGISQASCYWRLKGSVNWNALPLLDTAGYFVGAIPNAGFLQSDTVEYYLEASSNNGKTMTKPMTAPRGYYSFGFALPTAAAGELTGYAKDHLFPAYPNPARNQIRVPVYLKKAGCVKLTLNDVTGRLLKEAGLTSLSAGNHELPISISSLQPGVYFYTLYANGSLVRTRKLMVE